MSSRRELLKLGTLAGVSALIPGATDAAPLAAPRGPNISAKDDGPQPTRQQLQGQVKGSFYVSRPGHPDVRLVLMEVGDPALARGKSRPECFRALFCGPAKTPLGQSTYAILNRWLGQLELFLVPVGPVRNGMRYYEASFNRVVPESQVA
jgi:uncharacterized protein DUF6916